VNKLLMRGAQGQKGLDREGGNLDKKGKKNWPSTREQMGGAGKGGSPTTEMAEGNYWLPGPGRTIQERVVK